MKTRKINPCKCGSMDLSGSFGINVQFGGIGAFTVKCNTCGNRVDSFVDSVNASIGNWNMMNSSDVLPIKASK